MDEKWKESADDESKTASENNPHRKAPRQTESEETRRSFLSTTGNVCMATGLVAGYGAFGYCALRFLSPSAADENLDWQFVDIMDALVDVSSLEFTASSGAKIVIARAEEISETGFLALSSVCPHLGCQVFWEAARDRFFCPCHNGTFDAEGKATGGPPADANQSLTEYPTKIHNNALYVKAPLSTVTDNGRGG